MYYTKIIKMNKLVQTKGNISKHLEEMLSLSSISSMPKRKTSPEKALMPPKPISPPRIYFEAEPGQITSQKIRDDKDPPVYSLFQTKVYKMINLDSQLKSIDEFIQGGSRANWLSAIRTICKQISIPLIKEIIFNCSKTQEARKTFKVQLKDYLSKKRQSRRSPSPKKPPFLSSSKTPLDHSKHRSCIQAKEDLVKQSSNNLEDFRCRVIMVMNKSNSELMRTTILIFQFLLQLANNRKDYIDQGLNGRLNSFYKQIFKNWKEYTNKRAEKKEFKVLLKNSMNVWKKSRIMLAFKDMKTYRSRKIIRMKHYTATLEFKIRKRLVYSWRVVALKKSCKKIETNIGKFYFNSRLAVFVLYNIKKTNGQGLSLSKSLLQANTKKKLQQWYLKLRMLDKVKKDYNAFFKDPVLVTQLINKILKSLGSYKGLLEIGPTKQFSGKADGINILTHVKNNIYNRTSSLLNRNSASNNMFTLSVSNLATPDYYQEDLSAIFSNKLDKNSICNSLLISNKHLRKLRNIPLVYHIRKAIAISKDFKGTIDSLAELQDNIRISSIFYQKWRKKFCKKIVENLAYKFYSSIVCKKVLVNYSDFTKKSKQTHSSAGLNHQKITKKKVFRGFKKIILFNQLVYKSKGILAQKYFHAWIKYILQKAAKLEKVYKASIHYQQKLVFKGFRGFLRIYKLTIGSLAFRLNSIKRNALFEWRKKYQSRLLLKKVIGVGLDMWKERISLEFRSDSHMLAQIIKGWREICERKGNTKKQKIKMIMASNYARSKLKIGTFFKWKRMAQRIKSTKLIEKIFKKSISKLFIHWKKIKSEVNIKIKDHRTKTKKHKLFKAWAKLSKNTKTIKKFKKEKFFNAIKKKIYTKNLIANKFYNVLLMKKTFFCLIVNFT
jgi:hypothetical protein